MNKKIIETARKAALAAGEMAVKKYKNFDRKKVEMKTHNEYVTKVDRSSENIIIKEIKKAFPEHHILSEESGDNEKSSNYTWIVDPIDGTTNFTMHNPYWSISIGVAHKKKIIAGVVYAPVLNELYSAERGQGTRLNGKKVQVSDFSTGKTLNAFCNNRAKKHVERALRYFSLMKNAEEGCYQLGSAALELAYLSAGRLESMTVPGAYAWDVAAGVILVKEAGGMVTDFFGQKWSLDSQDMLASNGKVHKKLVDILKNI